MPISGPPWVVSLAGGNALSLSSAEVAGVKALVSVDGIGGVGQTTTYDGGTIPDPRRPVQIRFSAADGGATSDFLSPQAGRRLVLGLAGGAANSSLTESAGRRTLTVLPDADDAGLRWVDEHPSRAQNVTAAAAISAAVVDIQGA